MKKGFLEEESRRGKLRSRKIFSVLLGVYACIAAVLVLLLKDSFDISNGEDKKLLGCFMIFTGFILVCSAFGLLNSMRAATKGKNLILLFDENTKEAVGKIIDQEIAEGKILVEEYADVFAKGKKPHGERVILIPSYLLLCNGMGKVRAIPRDKIYWLCAQAGRKGSSSFVVRLLIFTEKKLLYMEGADVKHMEKIADKLYQHIPNVFEGYNPFVLSYELENLFEKNRTLFLDVYESAKRKE